MVCGRQSSIINTHLQYDINMCKVRLYLRQGLPYLCSLQYIGNVWWSNQTKSNCFECQNPRCGWLNQDKSPSNHCKSSTIPFTNHLQFIYKSSTNHLQIIYTSSINHLKTIENSLFFSHIKRAATEGTEAWLFAPEIATAPRGQRW